LKRDLFALTSPPFRAQFVLRQVEGRLVDPAAERGMARQPNGSFGKRDEHLLGHFACERGIIAMASGDSVGQRKMPLDQRCERIPRAFTHVAPQQLSIGLTFQHSIILFPPQLENRNRF